MDKMRRCCREPALYSPIFRPLLIAPADAHAVWSRVGHAARPLLELLPAERTNFPGLVEMYKQNLNLKHSEKVFTAALTVATSGAFGAQPGGISHFSASGTCGLLQWPGPRRLPGR